MHFGKSLSVSLLLGTAAAMCETDGQQALIDYTAPLTGENKLEVVPLNKTARTGAVPIGKEETVLRRERSLNHDHPTLCLVLVLLLSLQTRISG